MIKAPIILNQFHGIWQGKMARLMWLMTNNYGLHRIIRKKSFPEETVLDSDMKIVMKMNKDSY